MLHSRTMVVLVLHSLPPCSGSLVMVLTQVCCPPPHSALQFPVAAQADSKQWTGQGSLFLMACHTSI